MQVKIYEQSIRAAEIAEWLGVEIMLTIPSNTLRIPNTPIEIYVGHWLLQRERGFAVRTDHGFKARYKEAQGDV